MDEKRFDALSRALFASRSRRGAVPAVLVGIGTMLGLLDVPDSAAGKHKKHHKKKPPALPPVPPCALGEIACQGDPFACCAPSLCTACGCCPTTQSSCCSGTVNGLCYDPSQETCCDPAPQTGLLGACPKGSFCANPLGGVPTCCPSGSEACQIGCCAQGLFCCGGACCDTVNGCTTGDGVCVPLTLGPPARTH
jgi:hypothetical protein